MLTAKAPLRSGWFLPAGVDLIQADWGGKETQVTILLPGTALD